MKNTRFLFLIVGTLFLLSSACSPLEDYELYPELTQGRWQIISVELANNREIDSCLLEDVYIFGEDGNFSRERGACANGGLVFTGGKWDYKVNRDIIIVNEQFQNQGRGVISRRFEVSISADTLWLEELWEEGNDTYRLERQ